MLMYKISAAASYGADAIMIILLIFSIFIIAFFIERVLYYRKVFTKNEQELIAGLKKLKRKEEIVNLLKETGSDEANVVKEGFHEDVTDNTGFQSVVEGHLALQLKQWERFTSFFASVGSNAPFAGLLGTILGLMKSFADISLSESLDPRVAMSGISDALLTTVAGIIIAIPAIVIFNYCKKKIAHARSRVEAATNIILAKNLFK